MLSTLFNITVIAEWCCFITSLIFLSKSTGVWRFFIPLLFIIIFAETAGWYLSYVLKKGNNNWIFNLLLTINISFSIWMFTTAEPLRKVKTKLFFIMAFYIVFAACNLFFVQGFWEYNGITEALGGIILAVISCYFFYALLKEEGFRNLFRYEYFWLANGLLFSSLGSVLYIFLHYLHAFRKHTGINIYGYVNYGINVLLYGSLIIAFICRKRNTRS